ncbi:dipeptide/oligopeptide/nickel ABC transporter permease/ATP-binding protein [Microbacterium aurantiacum]|uniref:dipeptide/oligopeptide/nickel ABC transporter permease/ATP-binding protein n=1 Tax=Microbacterium aurantiacum TaxID=162393 RepID=UPI001FE50F2B|nr:dipeptide/oligopeptide/nickel ABC transporter permease/ATP-binding protein [Microbacterium aurantiacum]
MWRRVLRNPLGLVSALVLVAILLFGVLSALLAPFDPNLTRLELTNAAPFSSDFLLGGDHAGRDIFSRLMVATLGTAQACLVVLVVSATIGLSSGLIAGYFGGRIDDATDAVSSFVMALPGFVLLIALYTVIGPNTLITMAIFGVLIAPTFFRLVRSLVQKVRHELYVDAAKVAGLSDTRIMSRHILPVISGPVIVHASYVLAAGIAIQAGLEFLGLGNPREPSWGGMLQDAFTNIYVNGLAVVWPAVLIGVTTLCLVILGNAARDALQESSSRYAPLKAADIQRLRDRQAPSVATATTVQAVEAPLLSVRDLALGYPDSPDSVVEVVHGVDLVVERGQIHGLVGESGSGKSQIAFAILGILPPEAVVLRGSIQFYGAGLLATPGGMRRVRGRQIAYIPQEPMTNLDPTFTVGQQLSYGLRAVKDVRRRQAREQLVDLLGEVGIKNPRAVYDLYPHQISGGMAQRVLIAGALAGDPELIVADEPTTALDVTVQADVLQLLRDLQRERDLGMLLVTHNFGVVADICDTVSVMNQGRIVESRPTLELFSNPSHDYTQMLLGSTLDGAPSRRVRTESGAGR